VVPIWSQHSLTNRRPLTRQDARRFERGLPSGGPRGSEPGFSSGAYPGIRCVADDNGELGDPRSACSALAHLRFCGAGQTDLKLNQKTAIAAA
jgi:hypothetical protein